MLHRPRLLTALCCTCLVALVGCGGEQSEGAPPAASGFVHVENEKVLSGAGTPLFLRGVVFGDWFRASPDPPVELNDERDYGRVRAMGMNTVRLLIPYQLLEDDDAPGDYREAGFSWIDQQIGSARAHGVYIILALTTMPGGSTEDCGNDPFWERPEYLDRYVGLWRAIAERYARETVIAGYALNDNPNPSQTLEQWGALAEFTKTSIREVDTEHMLLVGRGHSIACVFDKPAVESFFTVDDPNVLYEFDRMQPWDYVAQEIEQFGKPEYGPYPDLGTDWLHTTSDGRPGSSELRLKPEETAWIKKHFYYMVTDEKFEYAVVALQSDNNPGTVYFDDIVVNEYDGDGKLIGTVLDLDLESTDGWYFWEGEADGNAVDGPGVVGESADAHRGNASITISGTTTLANLALSDLHLNVTLGHTFEMTSWIKGEKSDPAGISMARIDFWGSKQGGAGFDRARLEGLFDDFVGWGHAQGVPLSAQAFGAGRPAFNRGGIAYVRDMLDVMIERDLHFTYYSYHQADFGIYGNTTGLPSSDDVNQPLVELLTEKLR